MNNFTENIEPLIVWSWTLVFKSLKVMAVKVSLWFHWIFNSPDSTLLKYGSWWHNKVLPACQPQSVWTPWPSLSFTKLNHKWTPLCHISILNLVFPWFCVYFYQLWAKGKLRTKDCCQELKLNFCAKCETQLCLTDTLLQQDWRVVMLGCVFAYVYLCAYKGRL